MRKSLKVLGGILALSFPFAQPSFALIIEGKFSGTLGHFTNYNMGVTPDANFFREQDYHFENSYQPFTGTFWYDTDLVGPGISPWNPNVVMYISEADWLNVNLVGANGASIDIMSRGSLPSFSEKPTDSIYISKEGEGSRYNERLSMSYGDYGPSPHHGVTGPHRSGGLLVVSTTPILTDFSLIQNFTFSSEQNGNNPIGSVHFKTKGVLGGVDYEGEFLGEINKFEIHVRDSVTVSESSSIFLLLFPLAFLLWRADLLFVRSRS